MKTYRKYTFYAFTLLALTVTLRHAECQQFNVKQVNLFSNSSTKKKSVSNATASKNNNYSKTEKPVILGSSLFSVVSPPDGAKIPIGKPFMLRYKAPEAQWISVDVLRKVKRRKKDGSFEHITQKVPVFRTDSPSGENRILLTAKHLPLFGNTRIPVAKPIMLNISANFYGTVRAFRRKIFPVPPTVKIESPSANDEIITGEYSDIAWTCNGAKAQKVSIQIKYYPQGTGNGMGNMLSPLFEKIVKNTGHYPLRLPKTIKLKKQNSRNVYRLTIRELIPHSWKTIKAPLHSIPVKIIR